MNIYPVIWKELKDMTRDIRTLAAISLMPLLMMPLLALSSIYAQGLQPGTVIIMDEDRIEIQLGNGTIISSANLTTWLKNEFVKTGYKVLNEETGEFDLEIKIPRGFTKNLTLFNTTAELTIVKNVASSKSQNAEGIARNVINAFSHTVAELKVKYLGHLAQISIYPPSVLSPISTYTELVRPGGEEATYEETVQIALSKLLAFSLVFVTTPSIAYITDSVVGEKERKTFESLLTTPLSRSAIVLGKLVSASFIGLVTGLADAAGLILFFILPSIAYGVNLLAFFTPPLILAHITAVYVSVLASLALIMPIVIRSGSYRTAQVFSLIIIGAASIVFFISLYVDINQIVPAAKYVLYILPYTHAVQMIKVSVFGDLSSFLLHLSAAVAEILILIGVAIKLFNEEKIIYSRT